jgi:acyl-CoA synthetase (AMP-forming)/AMP-acid ligase II
MRKVIDRMHMSEVTICYGMTETSPVSTQTDADDTSSTAPPRSGASTRTALRAQSPSRPAYQVSGLISR